MSAQISGNLADNQLYSRGGSNDNNENNEDIGEPVPTEADPHILQRRLNAERGEASRAAQIKSATTSVAKKMVESEVKAMISWRVVLYFIGIPMLIMGGILLIFVFIGIVSPLPDTQIFEDVIKTVPATPAR